VSQVAPGELLVVVGTVGAGKSSLLAGILGEMLLTQARMQLCPSRANSGQCLASGAHSGSLIIGSASASFASVMPNFLVNLLYWTTLIDEEGLPGDVNRKNAPLQCV